MIFLALKPINISSNNFATKLGKKLGVKLGYSGTLDPFASGALVMACKKHTKLFRFLNLEPKIYHATIWLGASSPSLDNENIVLTQVKELNFDDIKSAFDNFQGEIIYTPPKYCAKKINGIKAYNLARNNKDFELAPSKMNVKAKIIHYTHPFIKFELIASKGTYVRSYAKLICDYLKVNGTLSSLERISEGDFKECKTYDAFNSVNLEENNYIGDLNDLFLGKKLEISNFLNKNKGIYKIDLGKYFSIVEINENVEYILNQIEK